MGEDIKKWQALPDEEKTAVLQSFLKRLDGLKYEDICKTHERMRDIRAGDWVWEHPVLVLRLADKKMTEQILAWMYHKVETSQGEIHVPFGGYFLEELVFDKFSLMQYSDDEKEILRQAMQILQEKGIGKEERL